MRKSIVCTLMILLGVGTLTGCTKEQKAITSKQQIQTLVSNDIKTNKKQGDESFPVFDFISEKSAMFHTNQGFYVYDMAKKKITSAVDLKEMKLFKSGDGYESKVEISADGSVVHFVRTKGSDKDIDLYYSLKEQKISEEGNGFKKGEGVELTMDGAQGDIGLAAPIRLYTTLESKGLGASKALVLGDEEVAFLSPATDVFMKTSEEYSNLCLKIYNHKTDKMTSHYIFKGYVTLRMDKNADKIETGENVIWWKRNEEGIMYYDVKALQNTPSAKGDFGTLVVGNVFYPQSDTLVITIEDPEHLNLKYKHDLTLNQINEEEEAKIIKMTKDKRVYKFTGLNPKDFYYIDYYPTAEQVDDKELRDIDKQNAKVKVTISNK